MKAHYFTAKQKQAILKCARAGAEAQIKQACKRNDAMMALAMYNIGLSVKTINKALKERDKMYEKFGEYREDGCADYGFQHHLDELGIDLKIGCDEI